MDSKQEDEDAGGAAALMLQVGRVQKMARSDPDSLPLNKEAAAVLSKATELFLAKFGRLALQNMSVQHKQMDYSHVALAVKEWSEVQSLLQDIVPMKVKAGDVLSKIVSTVPSNQLSATNCEAENAISHQQDPNENPSEKNTI
ncbi:hypothetical protein CEUSTIGMA_g8188.t1 [Chlamydomonas eustigma]|uniref:Transcription factor CBF/NF-Y/archaeal histone domain-containing protein n=1 Tax=Chlamydomonas eustigma TaxID=1157962 RepID=A0A250XCD7_9CHLO|nr:hypothetical protein CEUSTIGMA_g8188.t1 [Chlamydomonas eustigma]|eukprot:GAX80753.1 hypothetical protein CEUSTIGMA_g8188.t1 [Chlamydomonas eustigma]